MDYLVRWEVVVAIALGMLGFNYLSHHFFHRTKIFQQHRQICSVRQVWPPFDRQRVSNFDVVFFHGLQFGDETESIWRNTWLQRDTDICWPEQWLPQDLGESVRVLLLSYDAQATRLRGGGNNDDVSEIAKNLMQNLVNSDCWKLGHEHPFVLVGHNIGGLVIKALVVEAASARTTGGNGLDEIRVRNAKSFLQNLKGVLFYAVPHAGADFNSYIEKVEGQGLRKHWSGLMQNVRLLSRKMGELTIEFDSVIQRTQVIVYAFGEGKEMKDLGYLVQYASAVMLAGHNNYKVEDADHMSICKPPTKNHPSYSLLLKCLKVCLEKQVQSPSLPFYVVGLKEKEKLVQMMLQKFPGIGLVGMGGIGKTTLAKSVYLSLRKDYDGWSFLEDVKSKPIADVQKQLLCDLCGIKLDKSEDVDGYLDRIIECITKKKILMVVDDVGTTNNLVALQVLTFEDVKNESKLIVTCRNRQILNNLHNACPGLYWSEDRKIQVQTLGNEDSRKLFSFHAFGSATNVRAGFENVLKEIVIACAGLPLSLQVMGGFLCNKYSLDIWQEALQRLRVGKALEGGKQNESLWASLRICYEDLVEDEQHLFLDIACFFPDCSVRVSTAIRVWRSLGLLNLKDRSLVTVRGDGFLHMHDQLRDMGRKIVKDLSGKSWDQVTRLWEVQQAKAFFQDIEVATSLEGMSLAGCGHIASASMIEFLELQEKSSKRKKCFPNLKLLNLSLCQPNIVDFCIGQSLSHLKWLSLGNSVFQKLPSCIAACSCLHVLDLGGCDTLKTILDSIGRLKQLRELDLSRCEMLRTLPASIGDLSKLETLIMNGCARVENLPESFGQLTSLENLDLKGCMTLKALPDSIGRLGQLQWLDLGDCMMLRALPSSIGNLSQLQIGMRNCAHVENLPYSFGQLGQLRELELTGCKMLKTLPSSMGNLSQLRILRLRGCECVEDLPDSFGKLGCLEKLDLQGCKALGTLPDWVGHLGQLRKLDLTGCKMLKTLPSSMGNLSQLRILKLRDCECVEDLPDSLGKLGCLENLDLQGCKALGTLPDRVGHLGQLQKLDLTGCKMLKTLPSSVGNLSQLRILRLRDCERVEDLPDSLGKLGRLEKLDLQGCKALGTLPDWVGHLGQLQELDLTGCKMLKTLPSSMGNLSQLRIVRLRGCECVEDLPDSLGKLGCLEDLDLEGCKALGTIPDWVGHLGHLKFLDLSDCMMLRTLPSSIGDLSQIQTLILRGCECVEDLPDSLGKLGCLEDLDLEGCKALGTLPDWVGHLGHLKFLDLSDCMMLRTLPSSIGDLSQLQILRLRGCECVEDLPDSLGKLGRLEKLDLQGCKALGTLPDWVGHLGQLQELDLTGCKMLKTLPSSMGNLSQLQILRLRGCECVEDLPDSLGKLGCLEDLDLEGCKALGTLPDWVGHLGHLKFLDLSDCMMLRTLPSSIGDLSQLQILNLRGCECVEDLPDSLGKLGCLEDLDLEGCKALGTLPDWVGHLGHLEFLDLSDCMMLRTLPSSIGDLSQLQTLNLRGCECVEDLPDSLGKLGRLEDLDLQGCKALGTLPD